jgi:signal transduction histidine kinase
VCWDLAKYFLQEKQKDSSLFYSKRTVGVLNSFKANYIGWAYLTLSQSYELRNEIDSAYKYLGLAFAGIDSNYMGEIKNKSEFQKQLFQNQMRVKELDQEKASYQSKIRTNILLGGLFTLLVVAIILFRNNRQKQKANRLIAQQKGKVESTLSELRSTQSQLIQSEKMASLGELTAGIAHEIQNPLNFVNNFSELSNELIDDMQEEMEKGNAVEARQIAADIRGNLEKINQHGKRADAIVKNMLQHSRASSSEKEPTDINALADEYIRLAYHGYRAKEKLFNAAMEMDFDPGLEKVMVVPQDIGRVLLNLYNNAFYAVDRKAKAGIAGYLPTIAVRTRRLGQELSIEVQDNGDGIPDAIRDKIFQPFFTTKPTGQGTGLGLSLSYDIITKGHGGQMTAESREGEGTIVRVTLPLTGN